MKSWQDIGFQVDITKDGSPTLQLIESVDPAHINGEWMHHSNGANIETNFIYGKPIATVLQKVKEPHFMVVGLGMGYIEMNIAREALRAGKSVGLITSYESIPELREFFIAWLHDRFEELHPEVIRIYDLVLKHVLEGEQITGPQVKAFLRDHFKSVADMSTELKEGEIFKSRYHGILYDAFSSKTNPYLWEEAFLTRLLHESSAEISMFSTYACRGSLKRALRTENFQLELRPGFFGKRNSTLALRNFTKV